MSKHGRLIDADALMAELNNSHFPGAPYVDAGISIAIGKVCDAPTVEPDWGKLRLVEPIVYHCTECEDWYERMSKRGLRTSHLPSTQPEQKRCNMCKYYKGAHRVQGHAPCSFWNIGGVMYDDYCSRWEEGE